MTKVLNKPGQETSLKSGTEWNNSLLSSRKECSRQIGRLLMFFLGQI